MRFTKIIGTALVFLLSASAGAETVTYEYTVTVTSVTGQEFSDYEIGDQISGQLTVDTDSGESLCCVGAPYRTQYENFKNSWSLGPVFGGSSYPQQDMDFYFEDSDAQDSFSITENVDEFAGRWLFSLSARYAKPPQDQPQDGVASGNGNLTGVLLDDLALIHPESAFFKTGGRIESEVSLFNWSTGAELIGTWDSFKLVPETITSYESRVFKTGQTQCYNGYGDPGEQVDCRYGWSYGQDGYVRAGIEWPNPRFTDNGDGTVTDHLTNLTWVQWVLCYSTGDWQTAVDDFPFNLSDGQCGLTDGSVRGDWRLPNIRELASLTDYGEVTPALPRGHPFTPSNIQAVRFWSSTTALSNAAQGAWTYDLNDGSIRGWDKSTGVDIYVLAVRNTLLPPSQCSDGEDNDGDGRIDLDDKQCRSAEQNSETDSKR